MEKEEVKIGVIVLPICEASHTIQSPGDIKRAVQIVAEGTNWMCIEDSIMPSKSGDTIGMVVQSMHRNDDNELVQDLSAPRAVFLHKNMVTIDVFMKRCRELKVEHDLKQERLRVHRAKVEELRTRLRLLNLQATVSGTGTMLEFKNISTVETLLTVLEERLDLKEEASS